MRRSLDVILIGSGNGLGVRLPAQICTKLRLRWRSRGVVQWDTATRSYAQSHPIVGLSAIDSIEDLRQLIGDMCDNFRRFIEEQRGWHLLWNEDGSEKPESAAQFLLLGMAQYYLRMFDVEFDREVELGRGPVDFKVSSGSTIRLLIEVKKVHNGKFWNGLMRQLPSYMRSDDCNEGWFIAIRYRPSGQSARRVREPERVKAWQKREGKGLHFSVVDGRRNPPSASTLS